MKSRVLVVMAAAASLSACATAPDRIAARPAEGARYDGMACAQLQAERASVAASLDSSESAQRRTRVVDTVGVALLFVPVGSLFGGNHARQIGELKGERDALDLRLSQNNCSTAPGGDAPLATNPGAF